MAGNVGNSHHVTANSTDADGDVRNNKHTKDDEEEEAKHVGGGGGGGQEKSVLQAKLTKLAIQIGYAGKWPLNLDSCFHFFCKCFLVVSLHII